jgi:hypothetical protein
MIWSVILNKRQINWHVREIGYVRRVCVQSGKLNGPQILGEVRVVTILWLCYFNWVFVHLCDTLLSYQPKISSVFVPVQVLTAHSSRRVSIVAYYSVTRRYLYELSDTSSVWYVLYGMLSLHSDDQLLRYVCLFLWFDTCMLLLRFAQSASLSIPAWSLDNLFADIAKWNFHVCLEVFVSIFMLEIHG